MRTEKDVIYDKEVGRKIKTYRKLSEITIEKICEKTEISSTVYTRIERGQNHTSFDKLFKLARLFRIPPYKLLPNDFLYQDENISTDMVALIEFIKLRGLNPKDIMRILNG